MIELPDYWMGRDSAYPLAMTPAIGNNAFTTVELANKLLVLAKTAGVRLTSNPTTSSLVSSGWRPPAINAATPNAAVNSRHMTGQAIDIYDPDGTLDEWLLMWPHVLEDLGLWAEHPACTKGWCHVQTIPPRSGNRFFYP
jgi:hypothetical protein